MPYKPGQSGNPKGRPPGTKDKRTEIRELLRPHAPALVEKAVTLALEGDTTCLKLCLDKLIANLRPVAEPSALPLTGETLLEKGEAIIQAVSNGKITAEEGNHLLSALANHAKLAEGDKALVQHEDDQQFEMLMRRAC